MRGKMSPRFQQHPKPSKKEPQQKQRLLLISGSRIPLGRCIIAPLTLHSKQFLPALVSVMPLTFILAETSDWTLVSQRLPAGGHKSIDVGGNNSSVLYSGHKPNLAVWYRGLLRLLSCSRALGKIAVSALGKTLAVKEEMYILTSLHCTLTATLKRLCVVSCHNRAPADRSERWKNCDPVSLSSSKCIYCGNPTDVGQWHYLATEVTTEQSRVADAAFEKHSCKGLLR